MNTQCIKCSRRHGQKNKRIIKVSNGDVINLPTIIKSLRSKIDRLVFIGERKVIYDGRLSQVSDNWIGSISDNTKSVMFTGEIVDDMGNFSDHVGKLICLANHHTEVAPRIVKGYGVGAKIQYSTNYPIDKSMRFHPTIGENYQIYNVPNVGIEKGELINQNNLCVSFNNLNLE